jgi:chemotaxis protein methyltransferase CheR
VTLESATEFKMTDAEYRMFCELIRNHCGLNFNEGSRFIVDKRVARRVAALDVGSFAAYHYLLRNGPQADEELSAMVDALTTNETYFFREESQLRALIDEIIPELLRAKRKKGSQGPISIWSAGCSSGEEPYTVVALAMEAGLVPGKDLRVYASDISHTMLKKSRGGKYREASLRETNDLRRHKYFVAKDGHYQIADDIKRHVDFVHLNLMDRSKISLLGTMDVILCRNVIIYFNAETKSEVIETFHNKLVPGGYLLLGHAESLINISSAFELKHLTNDLVYRRPIPGEEVVDPWHEVASAAAEAADNSRRTE